MLNITLLFVLIGFASKSCSGCPSVCSCSGAVANCSGRNFNDIPENIPSITTELLLRNNNISQVDFGNNDLYNLQTLDLRENSLERFSSKTLNAVPFLSVLKLDNNRIKQVSKSRSFIDRGMYLTRISLSRNRFSSTLYQPLFYHLAQVRYIDVSYNFFTLIPGNAFPPTLQYLDLSYNRFTHFQQQAFVNLQNLTFLDLRGLEMESIENDLFRNLESLVVLRLGGRKLTAIARNLLSGLYSLNTLEIVDSSFSSLPTDLLRFSQGIRNLDLSNNRLNVLEQDFFSNVAFLSSLNLTGNKLNSLALITNVLSNLNLIELFLNSMALNGSVSDLIDQQEQLEILTFVQNNLSDFNYELSSATLTSLNLAYNNLTSLPRDAFVNCAALQTLNLTGNQFSSIPELRISSKIEVYIPENAWNCSCSFYVAFLAFNPNISNSNVRYSCQNGLLPDENLNCVLCEYPERFAGMYIGSLQNEFRSCHVANEGLTTSSKAASTQQSQVAATSSRLVIEVVVPIGAITIIGLAITLYCFVKRSRARKKLDAFTNDTSASMETTANPDVGVYETIHYSSMEKIGFHNGANLSAETKNRNAAANDHSVYSIAIDPPDTNDETFHRSSNYSFAVENNQISTNSSLGRSSGAHGSSVKSDYLNPMCLQSTSFLSDATEPFRKTKINDKSGNDSNNLHKNYYVSMK